MKDDCFSSW